MADRLERIRALATRVEDGRLRRESADTIDIHMRQMAFDLRWLLDEVDRLRAENGGKHLGYEVIPVASNAVCQTQSCAARVEFVVKYSNGRQRKHCGNHARAMGDRTPGGALDDH